MDTETKRYIDGLDIGNIPIDLLCEQYMAYIKNAEEHDVALACEFLSMASEMDLSQIDIMDLSSLFDFSNVTDFQKKLMEGFLNDEQVLALKQAYIDTINKTASLSNTYATLGYSTADTPTSIFIYPKSIKNNCTFIYRRKILYFTHIFINFCSIGRQRPSGKPFSNRSFKSTFRKCNRVIIISKGLIFHFTRTAVCKEAYLISNRLPDCHEPSIAFCSCRNHSFKLRTSIFRG